MTKKEIAAQICEIVVKITEVTGKKVSDNTLVNTFVQRHSKEDCLDELHRYEMVLRSSIEDRNRGNWLETEEGVKATENHKKVLDELGEKEREIREDFRNIVTERVKNALGYDWGVTGDHSYLEIGLIDPVATKKYGRTCFLFGHDFDVFIEHCSYLRKNKDTHGSKLRVNHGSMGSFDPFDSNQRTRVDFLIGLGEFVRNEKLMKGIENLATGAWDAIYDIEADMENENRNFKKLGIDYVC